MPVIDAGTHMTKADDASGYLREAEVHFALIEGEIPSRTGGSPAATTTMRQSWTASAHRESAERGRGGPSATSDHKLAYDNPRTFSAR